MYFIGFAPDFDRWINLRFGFEFNRSLTCLVLNRNGVKLGILAFYHFHSFEVTFLVNKRSKCCVLKKSDVIIGPL